MKVQVTVQLPAKSGVKKTLDMVVFATDTVSLVKERISSANPVLFQEQALVFHGKVLQDDCKLSECGIQEGASMDLIIQGCEGAFVSQLLELLQAKTIGIDELCLLYVHKHGISTGQVLETLGFDGKLQQYLEECKRFQIKHGCASVARQDILLKLSLKPSNRHAWSNDDSDGSKSMFEILVGTEDSVSTLKTRVASVVDLGEAFPHLDISHNGKSLDDSQLVSANGLQDGSLLELTPRASESSFASQLLELLTASKSQDGLTIEQVGLLYSCKYGVAAEEVLASFSASLRRRRLRDFLSQQTRWFTVEGGRVTSAVGQLSSATTQDHGKSHHERCLELHGRVSSLEFRTSIARALNRMVAAIMELSWLGIHQVVTGGAVGKGTAIEGDAGAEVTLFLERLPQTCQEQWPANLLESIAEGLQNLVIEDMPTIQASSVGNHGLRLTCDGFPNVDVWISPVFETHSDAIDLLAAQQGMSQSVHSTWLAKQQVKFMKKQPEPIKVTARLLKWWRNQQQWSFAAARPSDHLLELLAVHVAGQLPPTHSYDQDVAIGLAAKIMSRFNEAHITWPSPVHGRHKIPEEILSQRPLLADPCNPFVNVASPTTFDPQEMIDHAKTCGHLLLC